MADDFNMWAKYYEIIYQSKHDNPEDYSFYKGLLSRSDGRALEMACGTGRIYLRALEDGFDVDGVDISEGMLDELRKRAEKRGVTPQVYKQDVTDLSLDEEYNLIYHPFSALSHIRGVQNQRSCIRSVFKHLSEDGTFAFDMPVPPLNFGDTDMELNRETAFYDNTEYTVEFWNEIVDPVNQEHRFYQRVIEDQTDSIVFQTTFELSLIPKEQLEILLLDAGFEDYEFYSGFEMDELSEETDRLCIVARK